MNKIYLFPITLSILLSAIIVTLLVFYVFIPMELNKGYVSDDDDMINEYSGSTRTMEEKLTNASDFNGTIIVYNSFTKNPICMGKFENDTVQLVHCDIPNHGVSNQSSFESYRIHTGPP